VEAREIYDKTIRHFLGPITPLLDDQDVSEVLINGPQQIYYEKAGRLYLSDIQFRSEQFLMAAARNIGEFVGRTIGNGEPTMDARLPDGSRVHVIIPPSSRSGTCISIRRFKQATFDLDSLVKFGSLTEETAEFLKLVVLLHKNIVIAGGTGTGKTSLLNALSAAIPDTERIVVIEDSSELQLRQPHTVYLEAQPQQPDGSGRVTIRDLFVASLRMRPDRIVVGEVRRGEALDLIQSMISGHAGSLTTVHANTARDAAIRLETLSLMSDVSLPVYVARAQVASAIHLVVQIRRLHDGSRKLYGITECLGLDESNNYVLKDLYRFNACGNDSQGRIIGQLEWTGMIPSFAAEPYSLGHQDRIELTKRVFVRDASTVNVEVSERVS
jgi:pilus assembly protein CpaF